MTLDQQTEQMIAKLNGPLQQAARSAMEKDEVVILSNCQWAAIIGVLQGAVANMPIGDLDRLYITNAGMRITSQLNWKWKDE